MQLSQIIKRVLICLSLLGILSNSIVVEAIDLVAVPQNVQHNLPPAIPSSVKPPVNFSFKAFEASLKTEKKRPKLAGCPSNRNIVLSSDTTGIGDGRFYACAHIISIKIPNSVTFIGDRAFAGCDALTSVTYTGISSPSCGVGVFYNCRNLIKIKVPACYRDSTFCGKSVSKTLSEPCPTKTPTPSRSPTRSPWPTPSRSPWPTPSRSPWPTPSRSPTPSMTNKFTDVSIQNFLLQKIRKGIH